MYLVRPIWWSRVVRSFAVVTLGFGSDETESIKLLVNPNSLQLLIVRGSSQGLRRAFVSLCFRLQNPSYFFFNVLLSKYCCINRTFNAVVVSDGGSQNSPLSVADVGRVDLLNP